MDILISCFCHLICLMCCLHTYPPKKCPFVGKPTKNRWAKKFPDPCGQGDVQSDACFHGGLSKRCAKICFVVVFFSNWLFWGERSVLFFFGRVLLLLLVFFCCCRFHSMQHYLSFLLFFFSLFFCLVVIWGFGVLSWVCTVGKFFLVCSSTSSCTISGRSDRYMKSNTLRKVVQVGPSYDHLGFAQKKPWNNLAKEALKTAF